MSGDLYMTQPFRAVVPSDFGRELFVQGLRDARDFADMMTKGAWPKDADAPLGYDERDAKI